VNWTVPFPSVSFPCIDLWLYLPQPMALPALAYLFLFVSRSPRKPWQVQPPSLRPWTLSLVNQSKCMCALKNADHRHLRKIDWLMACTACLVCLVSYVSGCHKNVLGRGSTNSEHNKTSAIYFSSDIYDADRTSPPANKQPF
jgi:hypothetical protein